MEARIHICQVLSNVFTCARNNGFSCKEATGASEDDYQPGKIWSELGMKDTRVLIVAVLATLFDLLLFHLHKLPCALPAGCSMPCLPCQALLYKIAACTASPQLQALPQGLVAFCTGWNAVLAFVHEKWGSCTISWINHLIIWVERCCWLVQLQLKKSIFNISRCKHYRWQVPFLLLGG